MHYALHLIHETNYSSGAGMPSGVATQDDQFKIAKKDTSTTKEPQTARCEKLTRAVNKKIYHMGVLIWGPTLVIRLDQ